MRRIFLITFEILLMIACTSSLFAQNSKSERLRPKWMQNPPVPSNNTFIYKIITSEASSLDDARRKNMAMLLSDADMSNGVVVMSDFDSNQRVEQRWEDGKMVETSSYTSNTDTKISSDAMRLNVEDVAEFWTRSRDGIYHLYKLYARSRINQPAQFDDVTATQRYGTNGLWRSAIIPGWGQFYKGDNLKGGIMLGSSALAVAGIIFTECERADYNKKIVHTSSTKLKKDYINKRDNFETARNICIGVVAAVYIYNLIDAVTASGATHLESKPRNKLFDLAVAPVVMTDGSAGITAAIKF